MVDFAKLALRIADSAIQSFEIRKMKHAAGISAAFVYLAPIRCFD